jgi:hypothetical protein
VKNLSLLFLLLVTSAVSGEEIVLPKSEGEVKSFNGITEKLLKKSTTLFKTLELAIETQVALRKPISFIETGFKGIPSFPSFSECDQTFFRVATVADKIDDIITNDGWKSGYIRRKEELEAQGKKPTPFSFDALPPTAPMEERIIEYVRIKNVKSQFPKHSSIVGLLENPIRTMSVGYHTGYDNGEKGDHLRMDEIEIGSCAKAPECKTITPIDSDKVFKDRGLTPRYDTTGEWAVDSYIPASCVVATYRTRFYKVDDVYYSDSNGNNSGGK